jgi:zinc D-Ala-D-Ala carboxypeptidase
MQLTTHFALEELTVTTTGLDNTPTSDQRALLLTLAQNMEKVRAICGNRPITVSSAFRSAAVNEAAGGVPNSAHTLCFACDFNVEGLTPFEVCLLLDAAANQGHLAFDQLIQEGTWTHASFDKRLRGQRLTKRDGGYLSGIWA